MEPGHLVMGVVWYVLFLFSTVCHEAAHALAARVGGDRTAEGQVTLDPIPHIRREPFGMVLVPWLVFLSSPNGAMMGWASTPFDPEWANRNPRGAAWMALAGPSANLVLAIASGLALHAARVSGWFGTSVNGDVVGLMLLALFDLNVILFVLNLLPSPPLDGATAVTLLMPEGLARSWQAQMRNPMFAMLSLLAVWMVFPSIVTPVLHWAHGML